MTAGISTTTASVRQVVLDRVRAPDKLGELTRRVSRTATLDGGVALTDQGYSDGDRTLVITARGTEEQAENVAYLLRNYSTVTVSVADGCYLAALSNLTYVDGALQITALVHSRLSEA